MTFQQYYQMLEQRFAQLEQRQQELEAENIRLQEQLKQVKPVHIENINYKIQELTVQTLAGTLNIGLTALTDADQINRLMKEVEEKHNGEVSRSPSDIDKDTNPQV